MTGRIAQLVERDPYKVDVVGPIPTASTCDIRPHRLVVSDIRFSI